MKHKIKNIIIYILPLQNQRGSSPRVRQQVQLIRRRQANAKSPFHIADPTWQHVSSYCLLDACPAQPSDGHSAHSTWTSTSGGLYPKGGGKELGHPVTAVSRVMSVLSPSAKHPGGDLVGTKLRTY